MKKMICLAGLAAFLISCNNEKMKPGNFDTQGHRGCRGLLPENTWPAMKKALDLSVTTLEMDAVITKDGQVILSHEPFFNHEISTGPDGSPVTAAEEKSLNIYQMNYAEVQQYDVGLRPHPRFAQQEKIAATKPLLSSIFDSVQQYMRTHDRPYPFFNIETKSKNSTDSIYHPAPAEFVELLMQVIKQKKMEEQVTIQSFDMRTLQYLHQHYPHIKTALLVEEKDGGNVAAYVTKLGFTPTIYSPAWQLVSAEAIRYCHKNGMQMIPWTVNEKATIDSLKQMGVDGIISDYPNLFNE
ncbi:MAG TPA: glycerophosphodiester phosphodiesterase [Chitinophagaceae bacterium]|nr:glycerophosphodiester phosphodiesterase [Chitinophagaceae bacterium]